MAGGGGFAGAPNRGLGQAGPVSIFANRGLFGAGGHDTLHDLLGGISQGQLQRMQQGLTPGGFQGDFVGISPARLKFLANLMVANQMSGQQTDPTYTLQHRYGDGLFAGRKMPIRPLHPQMGGSPVREHPIGPARPEMNGMRQLLMQRALRGM